MAKGLQQRIFMPDRFQVMTDQTSLQLESQRPGKVSREKVCKICFQHFTRLKDSLWHPVELHGQLNVWSADMVQSGDRARRIAYTAPSVEKKINHLHSHSLGFRPQPGVGHLQVL